MTGTYADLLYLAYSTGRARASPAPRRSLSPSPRSRLLALGHTSCCSIPQLSAPWNTESRHLKSAFVFLFPSPLPLHSQGGISLAPLPEPEQGRHPPGAPVEGERAPASALLSHRSVVGHSDSSSPVFVSAPWADKEHAAGSVKAPTVAKSGPGERQSNASTRSAGNRAPAQPRASQSRAREAAELNQTTLSLVLRGTAALSGRTGVLGKELVVFTLIFLFWTRLHSAPHPMRCESSPRTGQGSGSGPGGTRSARVQRHLCWRRRRSEAVVQQSFIVRMDCTRIF